MISFNSLVALVISRSLVCDVRGRVVDEDQHCRAGKQAERVEDRTHDHHLEAAITLLSRAHSTVLPLTVTSCLSVRVVVPVPVPDRRDAVLPGDNSGVRAWPSGVDDHRGGALEQLGPGWVRVRTDQYIARGEPAELCRAMDQP
jgi:hypothetical protein